MDTGSTSAKKGSALFHHLGLLVTVTIWASTFINIKIVLLQVPPNTLAFLRFLIASTVLGLYFWLTRQPRIKRADWLWTVVSGLTGVALYNFIQNHGLRYAGATDAAILAAMAPVFIALLAWLMLKENIASRQVLGIVVAFAGSVLVATNGSLSGLSLNPGRLVGDSLILLTGLVWGLYNVSLKKLLDRYPAPAVLTYTTVIGTIFLAPLAWWESPHLAAVDSWGWLNVFYLGLLASALAYLLWNRALTGVSAVTAGAYLYLMPVIAAAIAAVFLQEVPTVYTVAGGVMALVGTYFASAG
ncbi:MAG: EamA family transporter [Syntrophomonadaceae bacterium]|nr:EamA family transporter [Syntrophomonadaceae bacterium]